MHWCAVKFSLFLKQLITILGCIKCLFIYIEDITIDNKIIYINGQYKSGNNPNLLTTYDFRCSVDSSISLSIPVQFVALILGHCTGSIVQRLSPLSLGLHDETEK